MILVTGAAGFVGYHLVNALAGKQKRVRCLVRNEPAKINICDKHIEVIQGDIRDKKVIDSAVKGARQVVHLAAVIQSPDPEVVCQVNVEGTRNLVESSRQYGVEQFVFFSTLNTVLPVKNRYSKSKEKAEDIVRKSGLNFTILRPSVIYGNGDDGTIARLVHAVKNRKIIYLLGNGKYKLQPVYIDDVIKAICETLNNLCQFKDRTLFLVGKEIVSYTGLVDVISEIIGVKKYKCYIPLSVIDIIIKVFSLFSKKGIQLEDKLKTYPHDKIIVDKLLQKDIFPLQVTPLKEGLSRYIAN